MSHPPSKFTWKNGFPDISYLSPFITLHLSIFTSSLWFFPYPRLRMRCSCVVFCLLSCLLSGSLSLGILPTLKPSFHKTLITPSFYLQRQPLLCSTPKFQLPSAFLPIFLEGPQSQCVPCPRPPIPQSTCFFSCTSRLRPWAATALLHRLWSSSSPAFHKQGLTSHFSSILKISLTLSLLSLFLCHWLQAVLQCLSKVNFKQKESLNRACQHS